MEWSARALSRAGGPCGFAPSKTTSTGAFHTGHSFNNIHGVQASLLGRNRSVYVCVDAYTQRRRQIGRTHVTALGLTAHAHKGSFKTNAAICCVFKVLYLRFVKLKLVCWHFLMVGSWAYLKIYIYIWLLTLLLNCHCYLSLFTSRLHLRTP